MTAAASAVTGASGTESGNGTTGNGSSDLFDVPRVRLLVELDRLRAAFLSTSTSSAAAALNGKTPRTATTASGASVFEDDRRFSKPIAIMGDYHTQRGTALRPVDEVCMRHARARVLFGFLVLFHLRAYVHLCEPNLSAKNSTSLTTSLSFSGLIGT